MITVSRKSWHYRLHNLVWTTFDLEHHGPLVVIKGKRANHSPRSLCGYFWSTALLTFLLPVFLPMLGLVIGIFCGIFYAFVWPVLTIREKRRASREARGFPPPKPNLVTEFVKAKKQRVCPLIEVRP